MNSTKLSAPLFNFGDNPGLPCDDSLIRQPDPGMAFALTGPGATAEAGHLPVRGDLAHIRLAGRYFVPHYAVPMPHRLTVAASLRKIASEDSEAVEALTAGATFNVLDIAGGWAWGQIGEDGFVGYLPMPVLDAA